MEKYLIRQSETGLEIESASTIEEARKIISDYEREDEANGEYEPNYYEIYDTEKEEVIV